MAARGDDISGFGRGCLSLYVQPVARAGDHGCPGQSGEHRDAYSLASRFSGAALTAGAGGFSGGLAVGAVARRGWSAASPSITAALLWTLSYGMVNAIHRVYAVQASEAISQRDQSQAALQQVREELTDEEENHVGCGGRQRRQMVDAWPSSWPKGRTSARPNGPFWIP